MAEVMVLVLFALLLLIGFQAHEISRGKAAREQLVQVAEAAGVEPSQIPDNFTRLVAAAAIAKELAAANMTGPESLVEARDLLTLGRIVRDRFGRNTIGQTNQEAAKEFVFTAGTRFAQQGKGFGSATMWVSDAATAQRNDSSNGRVLPPCATGADGKPAYVFTVRLYDESIEVADRDLEAIRGLDVWPFFERVTRNERLDTVRFLEQTQDIFEWSRQKNCRFFVWIDDATGVSEKRLYKRRLRTVGQPFYYYEPTESVEGRNAT